MGNIKNKGVFFGNFWENIGILYECKFYFDISVIIWYIVVYNNIYFDCYSF